MFSLVLGITTTGLCRADGWEANLNAGANSVVGGVHFKKDLQSGYMKAGISGLYSEDDDLEYKWARAKFAVGSDMVQPGLTIEVGLDGIMGDVEERGFSGDIGAIPFTGYVGYTFQRNVLPLPLEIFAGLSYAPKMLSFRDTEEFLSYRLGAGIEVIRNASVRVEYQHYDIDMEQGPGRWNMDDSVILVSLVMRF